MVFRKGWLRKGICKALGGRKWRWVDVAVLVWGAVTRKRSIAVAIVAVGVTGLAAMGSYYAFMESHSMSWALGYVVAAVLSMVVAGRHLAGRLLKSEG